MKNEDKWKPTKFVYDNNELKGSRDENELSISSRMTSDIVAKFYDKYIPLYAKGRLLDLGCGKVPYYATYKDYVDSITCVDWPNSLHQNYFLDYEHDLNKELPFNNDSFDTIILSSVLEHIAEPTILWKEMNRILDFGGILIMNVPFYYWIHETPHDYYRYTEFALRYFAEIANFEILCLETTGGVPEILTDILSKNTIQLPVIGKLATIYIQLIAKVIIDIDIVSKISQRTAGKFPYGYFMIVKKKKLIR